MQIRKILNVMGGVIAFILTTLICVVIYKWIDDMPGSGGSFY